MASSVHPSFIAPYSLSFSISFSFIFILFLCYSGMDCMCMQVVAQLEGGSNLCLCEVPVTPSFMHTKPPAPVSTGVFCVSSSASIPSQLDSYKFMFSQ